MEQNSAKPERVFISYASPDLDKAEQLEKYLPMASRDAMPRGW